MVTARKKIAVIGLGYVGFPLASLADRKGHDVIGIDCDAKRIELLQKRILPYHAPQLARELEQSHIQFTTDYDALKDVSDIITCVPTPVYDDKTPDLRPIEGAAREIGKRLQRHQNVVLESTVNPGVTEEVMLPILEHYSNLRGGLDFHIAHCPERINPGDDGWPLELIPRVVGSNSAEGRRRNVELYESLLDLGVHTRREVIYGVEQDVQYLVRVMPLSTIMAAELVKVGENSDSNLMLGGHGQLAQYCKKRDINLEEVVAGMETKPFGWFRKYPRPGTGVGGHCIPVDLHYLTKDARKHGVALSLYEESAAVNDGMPAFTGELVNECLNDVQRPLNGSTVAVLGLAYKENLDDIRDTPAFPLIQYLRERHAIVRAYDPHVPRERVPDEFQDCLATTLDEAVQGADAIVVATAHREFREQLTGSYLASKKVRAAVDGRNCIDGDDCTNAGIVFRAVSRTYSVGPIEDRKTRIFTYHGNGHKKAS
ncbi:MAG TPA: UDP binding domain-containing protein [Candidatus Binatia bacterium]|nr:UDP binding domain-containing protein [Candidatus Binatia bacterium]